MIDDLANDIKLRMADILNKTNEYILDFLRGKGYKPKNTVKYIKGLNYRLKKKGLKLVILNFPPKFENNQITQEMYCDILPIEIKDYEIANIIKKVKQKEWLYA